MDLQIYLAGPLFNSAQISLLEKLEKAITDAGFDLFSPRQHSEGLVPKGDAAREPDAWKPLFEMNTKAIDDSFLVLAVLAYPLSEGQQLGIGSGIQAPFEHHVKMSAFRQLELPDTGTVWEMGYAHGTKTPLVGFHPTEDCSKLNVMLTHSCDGLLSGFGALEEFLNDTTENVTRWVPSAPRWNRARQSGAASVYWPACHRSAAQQGGNE